ncbi:MAG: hemerythrin domain-containing protein [Candidatus Poseidoniaceae archaeon]|jgi:hemerythrin-like domain-containing protein|nr:hemerythrin domain-containing protein [Candidatus Poseidoniaceae archaeon]
MNSMMILVAEHDIILDALSLMETVIELERNGIDIGDNTWQVLVAFISDFADDYHHVKEEIVLFPAYCNNGMNPEYGPIAVMMREHEEYRMFNSQMKEALTQGPPYGNSMWIPASRFIEHLRLHIAKENEILFPMGNRMLDDIEEEKIIAKFNEIDASYSVNPCEYYRTVISSLKKKMTSLTFQHDTILN